MPVELKEDDSLAALLIAQHGTDTACEVLAELRAGYEVEKVLSAVSQQRLAQTVNRLEHASVEGLGQLTHRVDLTAFLYWHSRTNGECWKDDAFWNEFGRDNPAARVAYRRPASVIHPGLPAGRRVEITDL